MLSVPDLIEAGTLDIGLAAELMARLQAGASLLVGARPGGAGKTTVMCALLNVGPLDCRLVAATPEAVAAAPDAATSPKCCYVCHEIGAGSWYAYLWGAPLRAYCRLDHMLATNLHADDADEARDQICGDNGVPEAHFNRFDVQLYLRVGRGAAGYRRHVEKVHFSGRLQPDAARVSACRAFLAHCGDTGIRTIQAVRSELARWAARGAL